MLWPCQMRTKTHKKELLLVPVMRVLTDTVIFTFDCIYKSHKWENYLIYTNCWITRMRCPVWEFIVLHVAKGMFRENERMFDIMGSKMTSKNLDVQKRREFISIINS